jgi:hypothetical protein
MATLAGRSEREACSTVLLRNRENGPEVIFVSEKRMSQARPLHLQ